MAFPVWRYWKIFPLFSLLTVYLSSNLLNTKADGICSAVSTDCERKGGKCVLNCDKSANICLQNLCKYVDGVQSNSSNNGATSGGTDDKGCVCAVPKAPTEPTTAAPTNAPTVGPSGSTCYASPGMITFSVVFVSNYIATY
jgi:hypothetical protein